MSSGMRLAPFAATRLIGTDWSSPGWLRRRISASIVANREEMMTRVRISLLVFCLLGLTARSAAAQNWPSGPIRWLVGFAAGGTADMISRDIGSELEKVLGVPILIENRPGANGLTATQALVGAKPDGQTLMVILSGHITNAFLYPNSGFDPLTDVTAISMVESSPL